MAHFQNGKISSQNDNSKTSCNVSVYISNENNLWSPRLHKKWFILTQRMGSNMIIVRKISNNVPVHVDSGKDMRSKLIIKLSLAKKRSLYVY